MYVATTNLLLHPPTPPYLVHPNSLSLTLIRVRRYFTSICSPFVLLPSLRRDFHFYSRILVSTRFDARERNYLRRCRCGTAMAGCNIQTRHSDLSFTRSAASMHELDRPRNKESIFAGSIDRHGSDVSSAIFQRYRSPPPSPPQHSVREKCSHMDSYARVFASGRFRREIMVASN